jgi:hypothetical protein
LSNAAVYEYAAPEQYTVNEFDVIVSFLAFTTVATTLADPAVEEQVKETSVAKDVELPVVAVP